MGALRGFPPSICTLLAQVAFRTGEMMDDYGVHGLGLSARLALRSSEMRAWYSASKGAQVVGYSSRQSKIRAAAAARCRGHPALTPISLGWNGGSSDEGPPGSRRKEQHGLGLHGQGHGVDLSHLLGQIVINSSFIHFCRSHRWGESTAHARPIALSVRGPLGRLWGDMMRSRSVPLEPVLPKAGGDSRW